MNEIMPGGNSPEKQDRRKRLEAYARPANTSDLAVIGERDAKVIDVKSRTVLESTDPKDPWRQQTQFRDGSTRFGTYRNVIDYPFDYKNVPTNNDHSRESFFSGSITEPGMYFHVTGDQGENFYEGVTKARYCLNYQEGRYTLSIWDQENNPHRIPVEVGDLTTLFNLMRSEQMIARGYLLQHNVDEANKHERLMQEAWDKSQLAQQINQLVQSDVSLESVSARLTSITKVKPSTD